MTDTVKKVDNYVVAQHNALIEANYPAGLSVRANKVIRLIFSMIKPDDKNLREYTIGIKEVKRYLGYSLSDSHGRFNADLKDISNRLNDEPLVINNINTKKTLTAYFISSYEIDHLNQTITFEISGKLKPYLLDLKKNYTTYFLANIPKLKSSYSIRIYELLVQYKKIGIRVFELDILQQKVGAKDQSAYKLYSNFKNRVLKKSQKDLEKYTDIKFEFDELKTGRKVTALKFYILPNKPKQKEDSQALLPFLEPQLLTEESKSISETIINRLVQKGINHKTITYIASKGFDAIEDENKRTEAKERCGTIEIYLVEKLTLLEQQKDRQKNPAGFLVKAIKEDWISKKIFENKKEVKAKKEIAEKNRKIRTLRYKLNELEQKKSKEEKAVLSTLITNDNTFMDAFKPTMEELKNNSFFQKTYYHKIKNFSPLRQYEYTSFISVNVNHRLKDKFPEKFKQFFLLEKAVTNLKNELEKLEAPY